MVWLMIPTEFNGSLVIYNTIIRPYFLKHHEKVDDAVNKAKNTSKLKFIKRKDNSKLS